MTDLDLFTECDHVVLDEILTIDGTSPNYVSDLQYVSNSNIFSINIREFSSSDGLTNFDYSVDGITNFSIDSTGQQIQFGTYPVTTEMNFPDNNSDLVPQNVYLCNYVCTKASCPKCLGTDRNYDIKFNEWARLHEVSGTSKIKQQVLKTLLTLRGTNVFDDLYGSLLSGFIGSKINEFLLAQLNQSILEALDHLMSLQQSAGVPDEEQIIRVSDISAFQEDSDPRTVIINVKVMSGIGQEISVGLGLNV